MVYFSLKYQIIDCSFNFSEFKVLSYKKKIKLSEKVPLLSEANIVIAGGRSFGSAENFNNWLKPLGEELGAAIGGTRAAVEAGYISPELQIGYSGKIISPKIYIAFGISGSNHHMVGVKNAEIIIAVNNDVNAPIVAQADYVLIMDMFKAIPKMIRWLSENPRTNKQLNNKQKLNNNQLKLNSNQLKVNNKKKLNNKQKH